MASLMVKRADVGPLTVGSLCRILPGNTPDYVFLEECAISDDGTTVTVDGSAVFTGSVVLSGLPTEDPHVVGALWLDAGVLTVSTGA